MSSYSHKSEKRKKKQELSNNMIFRFRVKEKNKKKREMKFIYTIFVYNHDTVKEKKGKHDISRNYEIAREDLQMHAVFRFF